jgi:type I restriction enzyme S subunit
MVAKPLKRAFEGKLVPQDCNEPASVLLERIRAERAEQIKREAKPTTQRRPRGAAAGTNR